MAKSALVLLFLCAVGMAEAAQAEPESTYIVHMANWKMPRVYKNHKQWHTNTLSTGRIIYHYLNAFHGFAARMTPSEARRLRSSQGVLDVVPEKIFHVHTTHTPEFLGLSSEVGLLPASEFGDDVIVGVLDTGAWPESPSFNDSTITSPPPARWKGSCDGGPGFTCNNKLIGARFFYQGRHTSVSQEDQASESARDTEGHGSHTASTVAGSAVKGANVLGYAKGTARGMAVMARLAVYKVCWNEGCFSSDILAAMDAALSDGVDMMSMSLGGGVTAMDAAISDGVDMMSMSFGHGVTDYSMDTIAVGTFAAMQRGVMVSCSAGNSGPGPQTISNVAPWIMTVGASTVDRDFPANVVLGNGKTYHGVSLYPGKALPKGQLQVIYSGNASLGGDKNTNLCLQGTLDKAKVSGKIVFCEHSQNNKVFKGAVVKAAGGLGMILANAQENGEDLVADAHLVAATAVGYTAGEAIKGYVLSTAEPTAEIVFDGTQLNVKPAPAVAAFSSRGPNPVTPEIMKPDITAPGVNILAAWTRAAGPSGIDDDMRRLDFNIISGTSMSCPHIAGLAALLKAAHPEWSPAAIKSAMMTTATVTGNDGEPIRDNASGKHATPVDFGAGHVAPEKALHPGLIYDVGEEDYLNFLCGIGYSSTQIAILAKRNVTCTVDRVRTLPGNLNYPSLSVVFADKKSVLKYSRTLTSVSSSASTYTVSVSSVPDDVEVSVQPKSLEFSKKGQAQTFIVSFTTKGVGNGPAYAALTWSDGTHSVRSPIAFTWHGSL